MFFLFFLLLFLIISSQQEIEAVNNYKQCFLRCKTQGKVISVYNPRIRRCSCRFRSRSPTRLSSPSSPSPSPLTLSPSSPLSTFPFNQVFPDSSSLPCEIYRPDPTRDYRIIHPVARIEDCLLIGLYDPRAGGLLYYPKNRTCIKASRIQLTDQEQQIKEENVPLSFYRKGFNIPSYYAGYCSLYDTKETCEAGTLKLCGWKQGKQGINQIRVVDLGWCGRIRCINE
jgi:hypothetical protein